MDLTLIRDPSTEKSTIGKLYVDGKFECYTLEDPVRKEKIFGVTAIPAGTYHVIITFSDHFNKELPLLLDVPNYQGVRIHSGNKPEDTEGCILVGTSPRKDWVGSSVIAFNRLFEKLEKAYEANDYIKLTIK